MFIYLSMVKPYGYLAGSNFIRCFRTLGLHCVSHRLITIQIEHYMSSFQDFGGGGFVHNNPDAKAKRNYAHAALNYKTEKDNLVFYLYCIYLWCHL